MGADLPPHRRFRYRTRACRWQLDARQERQTVLERPLQPDVAAKGEPRRLEDRRHRFTRVWKMDDRRR